MSSSSALDTLFLPLERGQVEWGGRTMFLGAQYHPFLGVAGAAQSCDCYQFFKPFADTLTRHGMKVSAAMPEQGNLYDLTLVLLPKQVEEAKSWLAHAAAHLAEGGQILAAASNDAGGARIEKWLVELGFSDVVSESKNKARVVAGRRSAGMADDVIALSQREGGVRSSVFKDGQTYATQPGMFSWDRIDAASALLAEHFPPALSGHVADFGCGWGYLSRRMLEFSQRITQLTLVEADARSLGCTLENIKDVRGDVAVLPFWHDAVQPLPDGSQIFDYVIMNPPFHTGKKTDISLGQGFIVRAAERLKKGGSLTLVANIHLPYEEVMEKVLRNTKIVVQENGFKILRGVK